MAKRTLKTNDIINMVNNHAEQTKRINNARAYSRKCKRKEILNTIGVIVFLVLFALCLGIVGRDDYESEMWNQVDAAQIETETETEIIVNGNIRTMESVLIGIDEETGEYIVQTPDGHEWRLADPPEVYYTLDIDNHGTPAYYKDDVVVGLYEQGKGERTMYVKDVVSQRFFEWKRKVSKTDTLKLEKKDALETAIELYYPDEVLIRILNAETESEISTALITARKSA